MVIALAFKALVSASAVVVVGGGATMAYLTYKPKTLKDKMALDGATELTTDDEYRAIFYDQRKLISHNIGQVRPESTPDSFHGKIRIWCESQKGKRFRDDLTQEEANAIEKLCTTDGIKTIRGLLTKKGEKGWITEKSHSEQIKDYKTIFNIYKYNGEFADWLNITPDDRASVKYKVLQKRCEFGLAREYDTVPKSHIQYFDWWCKPLPYKTLMDKLRVTYPKAKLKDDEGWKDIANVWGRPEEVRDAVKGKSGEYPKDEDFKKWCKEKEKTAIHASDTVFPETYIIFKSVCVTLG